MAELSVRDKKVMVAEVKDSYAQAKDSWQTAIEKSISCGGKLVYYKSQIEHGSWQKFLAVCGIPPRTATGMMRMHEHRELLREKSAENWADAFRIIQAETNPNRQRIADLTVSKPVETEVPKIERQIATAPQELEKDSPGGPAFEPNRQCVADLTEARDSNCTMDEDAEDEQEKLREANRKLWDESLEYATGLTSYSKVMFVSSLLASIDTDSMEFRLLPHEIWTWFLKRYEDVETTREKTKLFAELFLDGPVSTFDLERHEDPAFDVNVAPTKRAMTFGEIYAAIKDGTAYAKGIEILEVSDDPERYEELEGIAEKVLDLEGSEIDVFCEALMSVSLYWTDTRQDTKERLKQNLNIILERLDAI